MKTNLRILIAIGERTFTNPFVSTLAREFRDQGLDVTCSAEEFWHNWRQYDIIHIQWPDQLMKEGQISGPEEFEAILKEQKSVGKRIVVNCHNLVTHYAKGEASDSAYDISYRLADSVIHLGPYSYELCLAKYPEAKHVVIPHHVYDKLYSPSSKTRSEALSKLGLDDNYRYILSFGYCRSDEERNFLKAVGDSMMNENIKILAPQLDMIVPFNNPIKRAKETARFAVNKLKYRDIIFDGKYVPDEKLSLYYEVSDIALIQRQHILNSGNVPMAFLMEKVCVGPNIGNVGPLLQELSNPTFAPDDISSVIDALHRGVELSKSGKGRENRNYALAHFSTEICAQQYISLYKSL